MNCLRDQKMRIRIFIGFIVLVFLYEFMPFVLMSENSIITIHDSLDFSIPWHKMFSDNNLFFAFDKPTKGLDGLSTLYYGQVSFSFAVLLYKIFDTFTAVILNRFFATVFGFVSMFVLLRKTLKFSLLLSGFCSICFAILPVDAVFSVGVNTLPLIIAVFFYFCTHKSKPFFKKTLLLLFFPFFSSFAFIGIFILGLWFLGTIVFTIKQKRLNANLAAGFILLCMGYILVDLRLFYVMFVLKTPLNRLIYQSEQTDLVQQLKLFIKAFYNCFVNGHYHAQSMQRRIILPFVFITTCIIITAAFYNTKKEKSDSRHIKINMLHFLVNGRIKLLLVLEMIILLFSFIDGIYGSGILSAFFQKYIRSLSGFNWGRIWMVNRVLWYITLAVCLECLLKVRDIKIAFSIGHSEFVYKGNHPAPIAVLLIFCMQIFYIAAVATYYNDARLTWGYITHKTMSDIGIKSSENILKTDAFITYKDFFSVELFNLIKKDIAYNDEKVVALGFHPNVLMYNGFNNIDGHNDAYPLSYMQKFRRLVLPEFVINDSARRYYDSWGGRLYLYNSELSYEPTKNKNTVPVKLNIDIDIFKNEFGGKYIVSRAEISNADELGLHLVKKYYSDASIYTIWLYGI